MLRVKSLCNNWHVPTVRFCILICSSTDVGTNSCSYLLLATAHRTHHIYHPHHHTPSASAPPLATIVYSSMLPSCGYSLSVYISHCVC